VRRVVPRRIDHCIRFDRIHTLEHRPSQASPALLRRNAAWIAVGRWLACPSSMGFSISVPHGPIPYALEQGIFSCLTGNLIGRSGKFVALISESQILQEADVGGQDDRGVRGYIKKLGSTPCATNAKERVKNNRHFIIIQAKSIRGRKIAMISR